jgi:hypothetical protein
MYNDPIEPQRDRKRLLKIGPIDSMRLKLLPNSLKGIAWPGEAGKDAMLGFRENKLFVELRQRSTMTRSHYFCSQLSIRSSELKGSEIACVRGLEKRHGTAIEHVVAT